jgi:hypothetical protein
MLVSTQSAGTSFCGVEAGGEALRAPIAQVGVRSRKITSTAIICRTAITSKIHATDTWVNKSRFGLKFLEHRAPIS